MAYTQEERALTLPIQLVGDQSWVHKCRDGGSYDLVGPAGLQLHAKDPSSTKYLHGKRTNHNKIFTWQKIQSNRIFVCKRTNRNEIFVW
jgi:hypothetical protein